MHQLRDFLWRPAIRLLIALSVSAGAVSVFYPKLKYLAIGIAVAVFVGGRLSAGYKRWQGRVFAREHETYVDHDEGTGVSDAGYDFNGPPPRLERLGVLQQKGLFGLIAKRLHASIPWTSRKEEAKNVVKARLQTDLGWWKPTQGTGERKGQLRVVVVAARGGEGKTLITGATAAATNGVRYEGALLLDVNLKGVLGSRYPVKVLPHNKTIFDLGAACLKGEVVSQSDFAKYTLLTDAGLRVARRPYYGQPQLTGMALLAILRASEKVFPIVWMDGGNTFAGVMETAISEADVCVLSVNPASSSYELGLTDASDLMTTHHSKPILVVLNQKMKIPATSDQIVRTIKQFTHPRVRNQPAIRRSFEQYRPDGLHIRILGHVPSLSDDRPLWLGNIPPFALAQLEEIGAAIIDLAIGRRTARLPRGKIEKALASASVTDEAEAVDEDEPEAAETVVEARVPERPSREAPREDPPPREAPRPTARPFSYDDLRSSLSSGRRSSQQAETPSHPADAPNGANQVPGGSPGGHNQRPPTQSEIDDERRRIFEDEIPTN